MEQAQVRGKLGGDQSYGRDRPADWLDLRDVGYGLKKGRKLNEVRMQ